MARLQAAIDPQYAFTGSPLNTANITETYPRDLIAYDCVLGATTLGTISAIQLVPGDVVGKVAWVNGATAAVTPTQQHIALYTGAGALVPGCIGVSSNTARAANTAYTATMTVPYICTAPGLYYIEYAVAAATIPTVYGRNFKHVNVNAALITGLPVLSGSVVGGIGAVLTVTTSTRAADLITVTATTSAAHSILVGDTVAIAGQTGDATLNGGYVVTAVPSSTTFVYKSAGAAGTDATGGTAYRVPSVLGTVTALVGRPYFAVSAS